MSTTEPERLRILVAEDSAATRTALAGMLTSWDYDVCEAADGAQAWEQFDRQVCRIVLTDWQMPCMDGLDLIRRIRARENTGFIYTILLTARSATEDVVSAMGEGADAYLIKPVAPAELKARIQAGERIVRLEERLERRRQQLLEARTQILEAEKLAGIGQLAAGMAHEVNNPIAVVSGNVDVFSQAVRALLDVLDTIESLKPELKHAAPQVLQQIEDVQARHDLTWVRETLPRYLESTQSNIRRVQDIITRLQDFSWQDKARIDRIDPVQAVQTSIDVLASELARARVTVRSDFRSVPAIVCHPARFNQAVYNVLHNAIQASSADDVVDVSVFEAEGQINIRVADRGPGIPEKDRSRIFQPFFTTRHTGTGAGLGLSFSHRVFREAGGSIHCSPRPDGGTVFDILIPAADTSA